MGNDALDAALRALSHPVRRDLLRHCRRGERTVGELAELTGGRQPATSQHLRVLRDAGLVRTEARGNTRLYRVDFARVAQVHDALGELLGHPPAAVAAGCRGPVAPRSDR